MAVSSQTLQEFKKELAAYLAGILKTRGPGPLMGKVGLRCFQPEESASPGLGCSRGGGGRGKRQVVADLGGGVSVRLWQICGGSGVRSAGEGRLVSVASSRPWHVPRECGNALRAPGRLGGTSFTHLSCRGLWRTSVRPRQLAENMQGQAGDI